MLNSIAVKKEDLLDKDLERKLISLSSGYLENKKLDAKVFLLEEKRGKIIGLLKECNVPYTFIKVGQTQL